VKSFKYLGNFFTDDGKCTCEIKSRIAMAKLYLARRRLKLEKETRENYIWRIDLYGAEIRTLR
jgi:hypothetical protein